LAFLDNMLSFFKAELDETGDFSSKERELKWCRTLVWCLFKQ
jgi:hypothetical protein